MRLFLSYRRGDSAGHTGRLRDTLVATLGADHVFQDVEAVPAGADFMATIGVELDRCDAVLAVIGPTWSTVTGPDGLPRLNDPSDYVRRELVSALHRDIPVVPVLVGGTTMPSPDALPDDLRTLLRRQAVAIRDVSWQRDVNGLLDSLRPERAYAPTRRSRRRAVLVLAGALLAAAIALGTVLAARRNGGSSSSSPPPMCQATDGAGITERSVLPERTASVALDDGGTWHFTVLHAYEQPTGSGQWLLLVRTRMTNNSPNSSYHADYRYHSVAVAGTPYPVSCFSIVAGEKVVAPNLNSEAVVGFNLSKDPSGQLTLILEDGLQLTFAAA